MNDPADPTGPVTLLRPDHPPPRSRGLSSLPPDLLNQVRGRVRLLSGLLALTFLFDPLLFGISWIVAAFVEAEIPVELARAALFRLVDLSAAAASALLWWVARRSQVSASRLVTIGLVYEVAICFLIAVLTFWQYWEGNHAIPPLTWVPVIIVLFPLILPGPPRRMLIAAIASAATTPLALLLLQLSGRVPVPADPYFQATVGGAVAVVFAYFGAKVIYGLGREVAAARELGSYRLEALLGCGGMGEVWRARHRMLARPAAVKLIRPALARDAQLGVSDNARARFEREAQVIASLRSPHTVTLFDFGVAADGSFYYAMELLDGLDADSIVRRFGPMPPERVVHVLRQMCHSLSEADASGVVHRDIKPANVFLCRYGEDCDFVKVLDFGLAKSLGESTDTGPALTRANIVQGTPAFIAPEQALGRPLDGRADIYATGCVAYWLLTGSLVFTADSPVELMVHHAQTLPRPPSTRSETPIPEALDRLVLDCLAKAPADRPATARELARRLDAIAGTDSWTDDAARRWWDIHIPAVQVPGSVQ